MNESDNTIKPEVASKLSNTGRKFFKLIEFDDQEKLICEIRKHPMGLIIIYLGGIFVALVISVLLGIFSLSGESGEMFSDLGVSNSSLQSIVIGLGFFMLIGVLIVMTIQAVVYINDVIFVTSDKIAQILYKTLFHRTISQLNLADIEDVTVTQKGVLAHLFNYGILVIETAGEQQNYTFTYIPDPYANSKKIITAHEQYLHRFGTDKAR